MIIVVKIAFEGMFINLLSDILNLLLLLNIIISLIDKLTIQLVWSVTLINNINKNNIIIIIDTLFEYLNFSLEATVVM